MVSKVTLFTSLLGTAHSCFAAISTTATADECSTVKPEPWTLGKRLVDPDKRLKKPYSHASLVKSLLDFNFTPPDKPLEWEVKGVTYILKA